MYSCFFFFSCIILSNCNKMLASNKFSNTVGVGITKSWDEYSSILTEKDLCVFGSSELFVETPFLKLNQRSFFVLLVHKNFKILGLFLFCLSSFVVFLLVSVLFFVVQENAAPQRTFTLH